jgi:uncharacterized membrane protein
MQKPASLQRIRAASRYLVVAAVLLVFIGWLLNTPPGLLGKVDAIGYAVCHRISERSFHIGTLQLPLCARCTGMYLGAMVGLAYQALRGRKRSQIPHWSVLIPLALFVVAFGVDGSNSYLYLIKQVQPGALPQIPNLYIPNNTLRLLTGSGMGLGIAAMLFPAFNSTVWADADERRALPNLKSFGLLFGFMLVLDLLVLTESPVVLYPAALVSTAGGLVLLTMVYSMVWVMIMGQDNKFTRLRQLWLALLAGLTIAMIQIAAIGVLRFWLTGTWGAFPLGRKLTGG